MPSSALKPDLRVVEGGNRPKRKAPEPEDMLREIVPDLIRAEETAAALQHQADGWRRKLANKRGVAFIRDEQVRAEFGR